MEAGLPVEGSVAGCDITINLPPDPPTSQGKRGSLAEGVRELEIPNIPNRSGRPNCPNCPNSAGQGLSAHLTVTIISQDSQICVKTTKGRRLFLGKKWKEYTWFFGQPFGASFAILSGALLLALLFGAQGSLLRWLVVVLLKPLQCKYSE